MICKRGRQEVGHHRVGKRVQTDFKLCANSDYHSRVPAGTRESLRKHRILKLGLTAHKVFSNPMMSDLLAGFTNGEGEWLQVIGMGRLDICFPSVLFLNHPKIISA